MDDLTLARTATRTGADIVARWANRLESAEFKGVGNPVTEADRESEEAIISLISQHHPEDGIVGEEGASREGTTGRRWLIDPLDGTVNFHDDLGTGPTRLGADRDLAATSTGKSMSRNGHQPRQHQKTYSPWPRVHRRSPHSNRASITNGDRFVNRDPHGRCPLNRDAWRTTRSSLSG